MQHLSFQRKGQPLSAEENTRYQVFLVILLPTLSHTHTHSLSLLFLSVVEKLSNSQLVQAQDLRSRQLSPNSVKSHNLPAQMISLSVWRQKFPKHKFNLDYMRINSHN